MHHGTYLIKPFTQTYVYNSYKVLYNKQAVNIVTGLKPMKIIIGERGQQEAQATIAY